MFSKIASITTSASAAPSPPTSARRRPTASAAALGSFRRFSRNSLARSSAGWISSALRSCRVTFMPRNADHAAMSPPITPAPITCTWRNSMAGLPPSPFNRFCSRNTRTRLREVAEHMSVAME
jgi:hypothetical protein